MPNDQFILGLEMLCRRMEANDKKRRREIRFKTTLEVG